MTSIENLFMFWTVVAGILTCVAAFGYCISSDTCQPTKAAKWAKYARIAFMIFLICGSITAIV